MRGRNTSLPGATIIALLIAVVSTVHAQAPGDFAGEPDKTMASAHESFVKGDMKKAADQIHKAAGYVKKEGNKVAKDAKGSVKKAGDALDRLGKEVKKGTVKSGDQLKKTFAQVDHQLASAWHKTADEANKAGQEFDQCPEKCRRGTRGRGQVVRHPAQGRCAGVRRRRQEGRSRREARRRGRGEVLHRHRRGHRGRGPAAERQQLKAGRCRAQDNGG